LGWRGHGRCSIGFFRLALHALDASSRTTLRHPIRAPHALTPSILWRSGWACSLFFLPPPLIRLHVARAFTLSLNTRLHTWYWCCSCTTDQIFFGLRVDLGKRLTELRGHTGTRPGISASATEGAIPSASCTRPTVCAVMVAMDRALRQWWGDLMELWHGWRVWHHLSGVGRSETVRSGGRYPRHLRWGAHTRARRRWMELEDRRVGARAHLLLAQLPVHGLSRSPGNAHLGRDFLPHLVLEPVIDVSVVSMGGNAELYRIQALCHVWVGSENQSRGKGEVATKHGQARPRMRLQTGHPDMSNCTYRA
jgi:hypothetical protein